MLCLGDLTTKLNDQYSKYSNNLIHLSYVIFNLNSSKSIGPNVDYVYEQLFEFHINGGIYLK